MICGLHSILFLFFHCSQYILCIFQILQQPFLFAQCHNRPYLYYKHSIVWNVLNHRLKYFFVCIDTSIGYSSRQSRNCFLRIWHHHRCFRIRMLCCQTWQEFVCSMALSKHIIQMKLWKFDRDTTFQYKYHSAGFHLLVRIRLLLLSLFYSITLAEYYHRQLH